MEKITFEYLKQLNYEIKSGDATRIQNAFKTLKALDLQNENPGLQMYALYLKGKYHYLNATNGEVLENLYKAHHYYKEVFKIARIYPVRVKNPKYHFKYAESAYKLSQYVWCLHEQDRLETLADNIAKQAKIQFPNNTSFKRLSDILNR